MCSILFEQRRTISNFISAWMAGFSRGNFVPHTDVSVNKMLRTARMATMTGRTAATSIGGERQLWAGSDYQKQFIEQH